MKYVINGYKPSSKCSFEKHFLIYNTCARNAKYISYGNSANLIARLVKHLGVQKKKLFKTTNGLTRELYRVKETNNMLSFPANRYVEHVNGNLEIGYPIVFESWEEFVKLIKKEMEQLQLLERLGEQEQIAKERFEQQ